MASTESTLRGCHTSSTSDTCSVSIPAALKESDLVGCGTRLSASGTLKTLVQLLRSPHKHPLDREARLLIAFVRGTPLGFVFADLAYVIEVARFFSRHLKEEPEYLQLLQLVLCVAHGGPPRLEKSSDADPCQSLLADLFTLYGELLMRLDEEEDVQCVVQLVLTLLTHNQHYKNTLSADDCRKSLEKSQLPLVLSQWLDSVPNCLYATALNLVDRVSALSPVICAMLLASYAVEPLLRRLDTLCGEERMNFGLQEQQKGRAYYQQLNCATNILWRLLSAASPHTDSTSPSHAALRSLRSLLHSEELKWKKSYLKSLIGLAVKLYSVFGEQLPMVQSGLAGDVARLGVGVATGAAEPDWELLKLCLLGCCLMSAEPSGVKVLQDHQVLEAVLRLLKESSKATSKQDEELVCIALKLTACLGPNLKSIYLANNGNSSLLTLISKCTKLSVDDTVLTEVLHTLWEVTTCGDDGDVSLLQDVIQHNGPELLAGLANSILERRRLNCANYDQLACVFLTLERLQRLAVSRTNTSLAVRFLNRMLNITPRDSKVDARVVVCCASYLWEAVAWCPLQLKEFVDSNGVFLLLDLIQSSSYPVQVILLGLLVDMTEDGLTVPHLVAWRGSNGYGVMDLCIEVWKTEEMLLPACQGDDFESEFHPRQSRVVEDVLGTVKPKIHALYLLLSDRHVSMTSLSEETYHLQLNRVRNSNQVYLPLIQHFMTRQLGQAWLEVSREVSSTELAEFDATFMEKMLKHRNQCIRQVQTLQQEILKLQHNQELAKEEELYSLLKACSLAPALEALRELDHVIKTATKPIEQH